jgi:hypothetical protein
MKLFMIGNGFDLSYSLPTKYLNFLNVIEYLHGIYRANPQQLQEIKTVADILDNEGLHQKDTSIAACYEKYEAYYKVTPIDKAVVELLAELPVTNMWCSFLLETFNQDRGWIDFEQEIDEVIGAFKDFLDGTPLRFSIRSFPKGSTSKFIIQKMPYFLKSFGNGTYEINREYMLERHTGSHEYVINDEKFIGYLRDKLNAFADALRQYLQCFVDNMVERIPPTEWCDEWFVRIKPDYVVTLNYTKTFEHFCPSAKVAHVHGSVDHRIVLGVNSDEDDEIDTADTTFIAFKKYYQRVVYGTDSSYLELLEKIEGTSKYCKLTVMGHSLDSTDKDIITQLFAHSGKITILYHSQSALGTYVSKLIEIYGKEGFDELRSEKELKFVSLINELDAYVEASEKTTSVPQLPQVYTF